MDDVLIISQFMAKVQQEETRGTLTMSRYSIKRVCVWEGCGEVEALLNLSSPRSPAGFVPTRPKEGRKKLGQRGKRFGRTS